MEAAEDCVLSLDTAVRDRTYLWLGDAAGGVHGRFHGDVVLVLAVSFAVAAATLP